MLHQMPRAHDIKITSFSILTLVTLTEVRLHSCVLGKGLLSCFISFCLLCVQNSFGRSHSTNPLGNYAVLHRRRQSLKNELKFLCTALSVLSHPNQVLVRWFLICIPNANSLAFAHLSFTASDSSYLCYRYVVYKQIWVIVNSDQTFLEN